MHSGYEIRGGEQIGRDPREMEVSELNELGHTKAPLLRAIREKCMDCCVGQQSEVRKCTSFRCALWPFRMGKNPFSERTGNAAALAAARQRSQEDGEDGGQEEALAA
jgi:hypothetical protein